jgi:hypothetical protein
MLDQEARQVVEKPQAKGLVARVARPAAFRHRRRLRPFVPWF